VFAEDLQRVDHQVQTKSVLSAFVKQDLNIADKMLFTKDSPCCDYRSPHSKH